MTNILWDLFIAFTRATNLAFGGGPAAIPLIQAEVVDRYKWMNNEEFADALAICNSLPGPIATKIAGYVGFKTKGLLGTLVALIGTITPTLLIVILLGSFIMKFSNTPELAAMLKGVRPVVVVLLAQTAYSMGKKSFPTISTWVIAIIALVLLYISSVHPAILIVSAMLIGYFFYRKK